jgi:hypothetical protein
MELGPEQMTELIEYLKKWESAECAICGDDVWAVADKVYALPEYRSPQAPSYTASQTVFPVITLTCRTCGNVRFLSAVAAGVVAGEAKVMQNE